MLEFCCVAIFGPVCWTIVVAKNSAPEHWRFITSHREITASVSKCLRHCIKEINAAFPLVLSVIDYRERQNVVRRPLTHSPAARERRSSSWCHLLSIIKEKNHKWNVGYNRSRDKRHYNLQLTKFLGTCQVSPFGNLSSEVSRAPCDSTVGTASHLQRISARPWNECIKSLTGTRDFFTRNQKLHCKKSFLRILK